MDGFGKSIQKSKSKSSGGSRNSDSSVSFDSADVEIKRAKDLIDHGVIKSDTDLDDLFCDGGFPLGEMVMFSGIDNTGKSTMCLHVGAKGYDKTDGNKRCLYITTETEQAIKKLPSFRNNIEKDCFDIVSVADLRHLAAAIDKTYDSFGTNYNVVVIDSLSQPGEREDYLPEKPQYMMPYRERSLYYKRINGAIIDTIKEVEDGDRDPYLLLATGHLAKAVRPDVERDNELIMPQFHEKTGEVQSAYIFTGSTPMQSRYLNGHMFIFENKTYMESMKNKSRAEKKAGVPTKIRVHPYKSRSTSVSVTRTFKITDDGVK